jgi:hypothetical protein
MDRWQPLGLIEVDSWLAVGEAIADLSGEALPGVFRLTSTAGSGTFELELAADGVVVE